MNRILTARDYPILRPLGAPVDPYWPVVGVLKPLHLWPFSVTGDYTDQGSVGGLNLTAQGSGNSFGVNGLVLNGSGWAKYTGTNADVNALGATFSFITSFIYQSGSSDCVIGSSGTWPYPPHYLGANTPNISILIGTGSAFKSLNTTGFTLTAGVEYHVIYTQSAGTGTIYINGSYNNKLTTFSTPDGTKSNLYIGSQNDGANKFVGSIKRVGVFKGTAWTPTEVAAIYAGLP